MMTGNETDALRVLLRVTYAGDPTEAVRGTANCDVFVYIARAATQPTITVAPATRITNIATAVSIVLASIRIPPHPPYTHTHTHTHHHHHYRHHRHHHHRKTHANR
jgi:hypothetical protein